MEIKATIRQFITENFYAASEIDLSDDDSLYEHGIIDSTGVLEVISLLEERYSIRVDDLEMIPENLDSIGRIAAFVARKLTSSPDRIASHGGE